MLLFFLFRFNLVTGFHQHRQLLALTATSTAGIDPSPALLLQHNSVLILRILRAEKRLVGSKRKSAVSHVAPVASRNSH